MITTRDMTNGWECISDF